LKKQFQSHIKSFITATDLRILKSMNKPMSNNSIDTSQWVDRYGDTLYGYAMSRLRNADVAADLVQETFLAALQNYKSFAGKSSEETWLIGILKHKLIDHFRKSGRETSLDVEETVSPFQESGVSKGHWKKELAPTEWHTTPEALLERKEFWEIFNACLGKLPKRISAVFTLSELEEKSGKEVCEVLDISATNLWTMLHRARLGLRQCLEKNWFSHKA
jgi:RNA polymerase sigma-70 factor (TIGR02943 family)